MQILYIEIEAYTHNWYSKPLIIEIVFTPYKLHDLKVVLTSHSCLFVHIELYKKVT
jgi:hypothetical protein